MFLNFGLVFLVCFVKGWLFGDGGGGPMFGPGGHMCIPISRYCSLQCQTYEKDGSGCNVCHCKGDGGMYVYRKFVEFIIAKRYLDF